MKNQTTALCISKSKLLWGLQCHKLLWTAYNAKNLIPKPDAHAQTIFDQGHEIGSLAKKLYPDGIEIGQGITDLDRTRLTQQAITTRRPLFEAEFAFQGGHAKADILNPVDNDAWDLIEVKSSTTFKEVYISDLAFQVFVFAGAGPRIGRCYLLLINSDFVRSGKVDPATFFVRQDVTDQVTAASRRIESRLEEMFTTIRLKEQPDIRIGPRCDNPYTCPLHDQCWKFLPESNVTTLYRGGAKGFTLLADGINHVKDIPDGFPLTQNQEIQRQAALSGRPRVDKHAINAFLDQLEFPLSYLDFETFSTAIPLFHGIRPYQQIPFQYSLHIVRSPGAEPEHHSFLAESGDPRPEFVRRLHDTLPEEGSVVVYNASFELGRLKECSELLPAYQTWLAEIQSRVLDLLLPFRGFRYYHPQQNGSASMKVVLPALTGRTYDDLEIKEGGAASSEYLRVHFGDVREEDRQRVRRALEAYCGLDTDGMIWIVDALRRLVAK